ncbi:MAG: DUF2851 family protein [Bacteroidetes bacterium]|nr:DUF2851 family protein [Bacteroidota bacterium]MBS1931808.1 DUF2851 family protein [Bacteroidota bacterium]
MTERLLQFIWQFQYFNKNELTTTADETIHIIHSGQLNKNQGPDFQNAKIKIAKTTWAGNVELHLKTSHWKRHRHEMDKNYNNVILHVVWENDIKENPIPVIELKDRVSKILLERYEELMNASGFIPCEKMIHYTPEIIWKSWKERLLAERLIRKAKIAEKFLQQNNYHWEETFWWLLTKNFGAKVNADAFEALAKSISVNILAKHKNQIHQLEALLLGQAGLLDKNPDGYWGKDDYPLMLQKEYLFLKKKYSLKPIHHPVHFLRMRPGNFPTIRLAQLAMLIHGSVHVFSKIKDASSLKPVRKWLDVTANDYWHYHYRFGEASSFKKKKLGETMIDNIIINTICPVLFAYGNYHDEDKYKEKALKFLEETAPETNAITKGFQHLGIENKNAFDSQALIELKNEYCNKKKCLECAVGNAMLKM